MDHADIDHTGLTGVPAFPPGHEFDYVAITSSVNCTATDEGTANTFVTGSSITLDGSTSVMVEFFAPQIRTPAADSGFYLVLFDAATVIGLIAEVKNAGTAVAIGAPATYTVRIATPSAGSHQYIVKGYVNGGTGIVGASTGGSGHLVAAFIRVTKV